MLKAYKIVVSENDEHRSFYRSQLLVRKSLPPNASQLVIDFGPVAWIMRHSLIVLSLKLNIAGIGVRRVVIVRCPRVQGDLRRPKGCCVSHHTVDTFRVTNCDHGRRIAAVTFTKEVGLCDSKVFQ